jgi:hypothetical protein
MFVRLHGQLVSSEMISFAVGSCRGKVGMCGKVMELGDSIVRALWHSLSWFLDVRIALRDLQPGKDRDHLPLKGKFSTMASLAMCNPIQQSTP